jgi:hypothetical protein
MDDDLADTTLEELKAKVGNIQTLAEITAASKLMTSSRSSAQDQLNFHAIHKHAEDDGLNTVWPDIIMYRAIGQTSSFLLSGQSLGGSVKNLNALDELEVAVVGWVRLASEGRLRHLEKVAKVEDGERKHISVAERLKAFLANHKKRNGFKNWNWDHMKVVRHMVYEVIHKHEGEEERRMIRSGKRLPCIQS